MRIVLEKGMQKKLILLAKGDKTWKELANLIELDPHYLCFELKNEMATLSDGKYYLLCKIADLNFDNYIKEKLNDNWGKSLGAKKSRGSLLDIKIPKRDERLSEIIGALLGDGNVTYYKKGKKIGVYQIKVAGDYILDKDYHLSYLKNLFFELFGIEGKEVIMTKQHGRFLVLTSKKMVEFFISEGLKSGDKIRNQVTIPSWVFHNPHYLTSCLRGLIDTDGSIFRMSNQDPNLLRISFTNYNKTLLNDTKKAFEILGYHPSNIVQDKRFFISRKDEITKYLKDIGFSNKKHLDRVKVFKAL